MSEQYPGGFITKSPVAVTSSAASGVWTMSQYMQYAKAGPWPGLFSDPYFTNVAALLHMDGTNGSTTFTDSSLYNWWVTRNGANVALSTSSFKFGTASCGFPVQDQQLVFSVSNLYAVGTRDFTIEGWYQFSSYTSTNQGLFSTVFDSGGTGVNLSINNGSANVYIGSGFSGSNVLSGVATGIADNTTYHHIAVVKSSGLVMLFVDGVLKGSGADTSSLDGTKLVIGTFYADTTAATRGFTGNIDDFRITPGIARYTGNFTVPTAAYPNNGPATPVDPFFSNVSLLLHMDGANAGTTFTDSSSNALTVTPHGSVTTSTTQIKWGTASGNWAGTTPELTVPNSSTWNWGTSTDFTVEFWIYLPSGEFSTGCTAFRSSGWHILVNTGGIVYYHDYSGTFGYAACGGISANTWTHVAVCRLGSSYYIFINGVSQSLTVTGLGTYVNSSNPLFIGSLTTTYASWDTDYTFNGYIDDYRITVGTARYTAKFTPPQLPFPNTATATTTYATWNSADKSTKISLANNNLQAIQSTTGNNTALRAGKSISTGKYYWECNNQNSTYVGVGVATASATVDGFGQTGQTFYYDSNGNKYVNGSASSYGTSWRNSTSTVGIALDADAGTIGFYLDNTFQGQFAYGLTNPVYPMATFPNDLGDTITANFGQNPLKYTPPNGTFFNKTISGSSVTFTNNNMTGNWTSASYNVVAKASGAGKSSGKWYCEFTIGMASQIIGIAYSNAETVNWLGNDANGWGYWGNNGNLTHNGSTATTYGATFTTGDVIGVALDVSAGTLIFYKNGVSQGTAFTGLSGTFYPAMGNGSNTGYTTLNTGVSSFAYTPPSGYSAWDSTTYAAGVY